MSRIRIPEAAALVIGAWLLLAAPVQAATIPTVQVKLTMTGCSGEGAIEFDAVSGGIESTHILTPVSWKDGGLIGVEDFTGPSAGLERSIVFLTADGRPAFAARTTDAGGDYWRIDATLDCSTVPFRVVELRAGELLALPDAAMPMPASHPPWLVLGVALVLAALFWPIVRARPGMRA